MSISDSISKQAKSPEAALDRRIILATQGGLPICESPFEAIAEAVDSSALKVKTRINTMLEDGRIRRIGVVPNHYQLGFTANGMSVWDVQDDEVLRSGELVGALSMVSHCYQRPRALPDWPYNLFAMVHGRYRDEVLAQVKQIETLLGDKVRAHDVLFSTRILKKTGLRIS